jgi:hypothetical protein
MSSPLCGHLTRYCFLFKSLGLEFVVVSLWGALSDKRSGMSFVSHFTPDSQSVSISWCQAHFVDVWPDIAFSSRVWVLNLLSCLCGAPSLTRRRMSFVSHFTPDSQSVYPGVEPTLCTFDQILLSFQEFGSGICCRVSVGRPLWREVGSVICQSLYALLSVSQYILVSSPVCGRLTRYCFLFKSLGLEFVVVCLGMSFVSHFTADSQYVLVSSPLCGRLTKYCFLFKSLGLEFALSQWGALSDERSSMSFVSHFAADGQYVLVSSPLCGRLTRYCFLVKSLGL